MDELLKNPMASPDLQKRPPSDPFEFHQRLPGYAPTPLEELPRLASDLGLRAIHVKDESARFGLPSFKPLGAFWAAYRLVRERYDNEVGQWRTWSELANRLRSIKPFGFVTATEGNHGRAVARVARLMGLDARIFVPEGTAPSRVRAIESEGATCVAVDGAYDDAVEAAASAANRHQVLLSDTSWPGYETVPQWVVEGYGTVFHEIDLTLRDPVDVVLVPIGVGGLAASAARHFRAQADGPILVGVEPLGAACVMESIRAGKRVSLEGVQDSIMAGLNCGTPSLVAWPAVSRGIDWFIGLEDHRIPWAMRTMGEHGIQSGETGAAALAGLAAVLEKQEEPIIAADHSVLLLNTEGATNPELYREIVGDTP